MYRLLGNNSCFFFFFFFFFFWICFIFVFVGFFNLFIYLFIIIIIFFLLQAMPEGIPVENIELLGSELVALKNDVKK